MTMNFPKYRVWAYCFTCRHPLWRYDLFIILNKRKSRWKQIRKRDTSKGACTYTGPILKCFPFTTENVQLDLSLRKKKVNNGKNKKRLILIIATLKPFGFSNWVPKNLNLDFSQLCICGQTFKSCTNLCDDKRSLTRRRETQRELPDRTRLLRPKKNKKNNQQAWNTFKDRFCIKRLSGNNKRIWISYILCFSPADLHFLFTSFVGIFVG